VGPIVLATELIVISEESLVALLKLHTDQGSFEFGINDSVAHGLIDMLAKFVTREAKPS
jgi:hypothetical protein